MTKFELAEMMGLRYAGMNFITNRKSDVYHFTIYTPKGSVDLDVVAYLDEHDLEWAKRQAAKQFFEALINAAYRD